jgi:NAD(P)-dependent dehydrogenase (short-subunit alcohol dehydrogenase family)
MNRETAVIVGVGPGLGWALVKRFAREGLATVACARDPKKLEPLATAEGIQARLEACDVTKAADVARLFATVERELGVPGVVVFNAGAYERGAILELTPESFERCWRVGCLGGFHVGQAAARLMVAKGSGTILFTGATASLRGGAGFANLAVPKFGLRALAQSMARELQPKGVHVAHVIIDGQIASEARRGLAAERGPDSLLSPDAIAETYYQLHRQPRTAWTHELDLRPWMEKW